MKKIVIFLLLVYVLLMPVAVAGDGFPLTGSGKPFLEPPAVGQTKKENKFKLILLKSDKFGPSYYHRFYPHITNRSYTDCSSFKYIDCRDIRFSECWQCRNFMYKDRVYARESNSCANGFCGDH